MLAWIIFKVVRHAGAESPVILRVRFPDGSSEQTKEGTPHITIIVKHWLSFLRLVLFGSYGFFTDFIKLKIDIEGDLRYLDYLTSKSPSGDHLKAKIRADIRPDTLLTYLLNRWHMLMHLAWSYSQSQYNAEYHYGLHPEFYFNYLGPTGAYSTGFWYEDTKDVDESQRIKWECILRKLRLTEPGLRICSVGAGFGYGEMLAAEKYGAIVDCYNICRPQVAWLREEVKRRGLEGRVNVYEADYRDLYKMPNFYDRFLAIECVEHAGDIFRKRVIAAWTKCLKDGGIGIIQWLSFDIPSDVALSIRKYLYPGVTMPPLGQTIDDVVSSGCEILDLLCNRRHYHYTLDAWTDNFIKNWEKIHAIDPVFYNESFRRKWLAYLSLGSGYLVSPNATARLYQLTYCKGDTDTYPMNREFLYDDSASDAAWVKPHPWVLRERETFSR